MANFDTRCIHAGEEPDAATGAHGVPLFQNVTFAFENYDEIAAYRRGDLLHYSYSPRGNPTVRSLENKIADLEGAEAAIALNSGMAAIGSAIMAVAAGGGHLITSEFIYDLTREFLHEELPLLGGSASLVDLNDPTAIAAAITPQTRAIYAEPVSNPTLRVTDIPRLAQLAHRHGLPLIVDNTFLSPALFRPIEHGADVVIHSATKYLSGNGQVQGGVVSGTSEFIAGIRDRAQHFGTAMPPFSAWILLAGIHTLALRMTRHSENAMQIAALLEQHPAVSAVNFPGLPSDAGHERATSYLEPGRFGGMLSFTLKGGVPAVAAFIDTLKVCTIAVSLGDASTLAWPWPWGELVRISAGLEDPQDLSEDIAQALDNIELALAAD